MHCCRRHSADDVCSEAQPDPCHLHSSSNDLTNQQQRMIDLLKLRSDELSTENAKLRLRVATGSASKQLPEQVSKHYIPGLAAVSMQHAPWMQCSSPDRPASSTCADRPKCAGHADR